MAPRARMELQLRLVSAVYRAELRRGDPEVVEAVLERALALLDRVEPEVNRDPELRALLAKVRGELSGLPN